MYIELYLRGGLGNQLYQYAYARFLQKNNKISKLLINTYDYKKYKLRNVELSNFALSSDVEFTNRISVKDLFIKKLFHVLFYVKDKIAFNRPEVHLFSFLGKKYLCSIEDTVTDIEKINCDLFLYGYFADTFYPVKMHKILMNDMVYKGNQSVLFHNLKDKINSSYSIGVSIRVASDYIDNNWPICSEKFYYSGINLLLNLNNKDKNTIIYIFADDIEYVKKNHWFSKYKNVTYISGLSVSESFELLRTCSSYVCSNSSFSWWGAFLSYNQKKTTILPDITFEERYKKYNEKLFLKDAIYLDHISGEKIRTE